MADARKRPVELRNPMDEVETFGHYFLMVLRRITNENYRKETEQRLISVLMECIQNKPVKLKSFLNTVRKFQ